MEERRSPKPDVAGSNPVVSAERPGQPGAYDEGNLTHKTTAEVDTEAQPRSVRGAIPEPCPALAAGHTGVSRSGNRSGL